MTGQTERVYEAYEADPSEQPGMAEAMQEYEDALRRLNEGTFPVSEGTMVFRVINGLKVGSRTPSLEEGDIVTDNYATPYAASVAEIMRLNDIDENLRTHNPYDNYQRVALINVEKFEIPKPDITHKPGIDRDQVIVSGTVLEVLTPNEFISRFPSET